MDYSHRWHYIPWRGNGATAGTIFTGGGIIATAGTIFTGGGIIATAGTIFPGGGIIATAGTILRYISLSGDGATAGTIFMKAPIPALHTALVNSL